MKLFNIDTRWVPGQGVDIVISYGERQGERDTIHTSVRGVSGQRYETVLNCVGAEIQEKINSLLARDMVYGAISGTAPRDSETS